MELNPINLRKYRDFGQLISDTFLFIKQEHKLLLRVLLSYVGPFVLITAFLGAWTQTDLFRSMEPDSITDPVQMFETLGIKYLLYIVAALVSNTMLMTTVYSYMALYSKHGAGGFAQDDVWNMTREYFLPVIAVLFVLGILIFIGFLLCIFPGFYLFGVLSLAVAVVVFEDGGIGDSFQRSMYLVRDDFWFALGISIVISLIAGLLGAVFVMPAGMMSFLVMFNSLNNESIGSLSTIYLVLSAAGTFCASIIYGIPYITLSMFYTSQVEKKESPGLLEKIDQINKKTAE